MILRRSAVLLVLLVCAACAPRPVTQVDDQGIVRREGQVQGKRQVGSWTYRDASGAVEATGSWEGDKQIGPWTWYHPDGSVKQTGTYLAMGLRSGWWSFHHPGGARQSAGAYGDGGDGLPERQQGPWTYWRGDGSPSACGTFVDGSRALIWTAWSADGSVESQGACWQGRRVGPWRDGGTESDRGLPAGFTLYADQVGGLQRWGMLKEGRCEGTWVLRDGDRILAAADRGQSLRHLAVLREDATVEAWIRFADQGGRRVTLFADGVPVADAAALPPEGDTPLPERIDRIIAAFLAPLTETARPAPLADAAPAPRPESLQGVAISPTPVVPQFWTTLEEASAASLLRAYTKGRQQMFSEYDFSAPAGGDQARSRKLMDQPLPDVRVIDPKGRILDLADGGGKRTVVVVMRGFFGQVCIYCATQTAALAGNIDRFLGNDARLVVLYPGPAESVPAFLDAVRSLGADVPEALTVAIDPDLAFVKAMGIEHMLATPTTLIVGRDRAVGWAYVGRSKDDRPSVDQIVSQLEGLP